MSKRQIVLPVVACFMLLALGSIANLAMGDDGPPAVSTTTQPTASTTDPGMGGSTTAPTTSTDDATTTQPTTTDPSTTTATTTDPVTTTQPAPTTTDPPATTTQPAVTNQDTVAPVATISNTTTVAPQTTTQADATVTQPATTTQPATPSTPPTAPCDTTQITCGNNAATQIALVSQTCAASSDNASLSVQVQTLAGAPVNNVTISPQTSCLNFAEITQIVEQFCEGCTVIVIPPPPPVIYVQVPGTNTVTVQNNTNTVTQLQTIHIMAYCVPKPIMVSGEPKLLFYLPVGTPQKSKTYAKAVPATFVPGVGMKCKGNDVTTAQLAVAHVPMFTLSVPASFVGQSLKLCLQPALTNKKQSCHTVPISHGAIISVPVTSNLVATVIKTKAKSKVKSKIIKSATSSLASVAGLSK